MKLSTPVRIIIIVAAVMIPVILLGVAGLGYLVYQRVHGLPFVVAHLEPLESTPYTDSTKGYYFRPPLGWTFKAPNSMRKYPLWESPTSDTVGGRPYTPNIVVSVETASSSMILMDPLIARYKADHPDFHVVSKRHVSINGRTSDMLEFTYTVKTGWIIHIRQALIGAGGMVYVFTSTAHNDMWATHRATFDSSLSTFEVTR